CCRERWKTPVRISAWMLETEERGKERDLRKKMKQFLVCSVAAGGEPSQICQARWTKDRRTAYYL
uniref:Uncharacterized protein n=1 Tax=Gopherus agassizii TaxID=38772 RepID=A0A452HGB9_9SAUR